MRVLRCPECGREVRREEDLGRTRRRGWWLVLALVCLAFPVVLLSGPLLTRAYYALMPRWKTVERHVQGETVVLLQQVRNPQDFGERVVIRGSGGEPLVIEDFKVNLGDGVPTLGRARLGVFMDITGEGVPDLLVSGFSGGAHCCHTFHVVSLSASPVMLATIEAHDGGQFVFADDGVAEFRGIDWHYAYWRSSFVDSPRPEIVLRWDGSRYALHLPGMLKDAPAEAELAAEASRVRDAFTRIEGNEPVPPALGAWMLDLMYTGHEALAWRFLDMAWPDGVEGKDLYAAEMRHQMAGSAYWREFKNLTQDRP